MTTEAIAYQLVSGTELTEETRAQEPRCLACGRVGHAIQACGAIRARMQLDHRDAHAETIHALRIALDDAHQHVGALVRTGEDTLAHVWQTRHGKVAAEAHRIALSAARAWLGRKA